jgi:hypothetical protein
MSDGLQSGPALGPPVGEWPRHLGPQTQAVRNLPIPSISTVATPVGEQDRGWLRSWRRWLLQGGGREMPGRFTAGLVASAHRRPEYPSSGLRPRRARLRFSERSESSSEQIKSRAVRLPNFGGGPNVPDGWLASCVRGRKGGRSAVPKGPKRSGAREHPTGIARNAPNHDPRMTRTTRMKSEGWR